MSKYILILFLSFFYCSFGQEFSVELFFEDSAGNQDSIILGYDDNATDAIDSSFGENNIISIPYNSGLEVRISDEQKSRTTFPDPIPATYHTKKQIFQKGCPTNFSVQAIDIITENWPVTVSWNNSLFNDDCRNGSVFTSINPGGWWDTGSPSEFECGFFRVELLNDNQITFCDNTEYPEFANNENYSYLIDNNTIVSVFWFTFGNQSLLLNTEDYNLSKVLAYPNPTNNKVKFNINRTNLEIENIELFDISGKKSKIKLDSNDSINLKDFEVGIYFVRLTFKNGNTLLKRIIKN
ncbi:T9SS type A sorting domain-containing protein [Psychroserpens sp. SPM9]|uniref:T9SS type A sorting domain-containing protein n=1 Tax=Psychroserpens sp. SPM9 TaxID=2975598 RepID=UPI0021A82A2A|nr:T9SS type A sorting domain-containing protein [Psychroserpens sp. SPM9]MDG5493211.1 T9SS type A sorting domain-containing protein [Psychroserpens sp. SPM9]